MSVVGRMRIRSFSGFLPNPASLLVMFCRQGGYESGATATIQRRRYARDVISCLMRLDFVSTLSQLVYCDLTAAASAAEHAR